MSSHDESVGTLYLEVRHPVRIAALPLGGQAIEVGGLQKRE
jgi:hypothetical protein